MAHRVFRLSIRPAHAPEVRRVVDFDGRATLHDVHEVMRRTLQLQGERPYAFYLSGEYLDRATEYGATEESAHDSTRSRLFRLRLREGQTFAHSFGSKGELRHSVSVVSIAEVPSPLPEAVVVESVGDAPAPHHADEDEPGPDALPEHLAEVAPLAEALLSLSERLDVLYEEDDAQYEQASRAGGQAEPEGPPAAIVSLLRELSDVALELAAALEEDEEAVDELDHWFDERELVPRLAELPLALLSVGELESALAVARAYTFVAPESYEGDVAIVLAESGRRDEALAQLEVNASKYPDSFLTALKTGAAHEALGDAAAAEAAYRRAVSLAADPEEREEAMTQLRGFLEDAGRAEEPPVRVGGEQPQPPRSMFAAVGRNDPCPCGSGKKHKKCHGA